MTNTGYTPTSSRPDHSRLEDQMTSYELAAAERSSATRNQAAQRARRATLLDEASAVRPQRATSRRLRFRFRLPVSRPA